jgi:3-phenylpropionate/trans-cinnamate dioxygenase ferredoxin component
MAVRVGKAGDVPVGGLRAFTVGGRRVAIANAGGTFYGIDDTCTHMGCSLADGALDGTTVTCACHGSEFDVATGEVVDGPAEDPVGTWAVHAEGGELIVDA